MAGKLQGIGVWRKKHGLGRRGEEKRRRGEEEKRRGEEEKRRREEKPTLSAKGAERVGHPTWFKSLHVPAASKLGMTRFSLGCWGGNRVGGGCAEWKGET